MNNKDGKCLCLGCGRRVDGLFSSNGHKFACPVVSKVKPSGKSS